MTVDIDVDVGHGGRLTKLYGTINVTDSLSGQIGFEHPTSYHKQDYDRPTTTDLGRARICGDSAWWVVSDAYDPYLRPFNSSASEPARDWFPGFTPVLLAHRRLTTTKGADIRFPTGVKSEPGHFQWFWKMALGNGRRMSTLCAVYGLLESDVLMLRSPHVWF